MKVLILDIHKGLFECSNRMRINTFEYKDNGRHWKLSEASFDQLTLLVGASGVGKTQILRAIDNMRDISKGRSLNGVAWDLNFSTTKGNKYRWQGEFEVIDKRLPLFEEDKEELAPKIVSEKITDPQTGNTYIERVAEKIIFNNQQTLKLTRNKSLLAHLEEEFIEEMKHELDKVSLQDHSEAQRETMRIDVFEMNTLFKEYASVEAIREADLPVIAKLYWIEKKDTISFNDIVGKFRAIFPQVEQLKIAPMEGVLSELPSFFRELPVIQIKEAGVSHWIEQRNISSGMFRALMHISEIYLAPEGAVFLIDEFENSLGINCIDELTTGLLEAGRDLQFIITSHHPYIINAIDLNDWKLVTRKGGVVSTRGSELLNLGRSKHSAFMQLTQLEEFQNGGIETE